MLYLIVDQAQLAYNGQLIGAVTVRRALEAYGAVFAHIGTVLGIWLCSDVEIRKYRDIGNCSY